MRITVLLAALLLTLCLSFCNRKVSDATQSSTEHAMEIADKKYSQYTLMANTSGSHTVVINRASYKAGHGPKAFKFFIYENINMAVVLEDGVEAGHVSWIDGEHIKVERYIGEIDDEPADRGYTFNVNTKTKTKLK